MSGGGFGRRILGVVLLTGALGVGAASCSSGPSAAAKGPSAAAKGLCGSVVLVVPPSSLVAVSTQTIRDGEDSGDASLDRLAKMWLTELKVPYRTGTPKAEPLLGARCRQLGIPLGTFTPPST
jgi:hypothetical protein